MSTKKNTKNFIEPAEFYDEMVSCIANDNTISEKLGGFFQLHAEKFANHQNFVRYQHIREELVSIGIVSCCSAFPKFRPLRDKEATLEEAIETSYHYETCNNPFAYFTRCMYNDIINYLKSYYNESNIVNELKIRSGLEPDFGYVEMQRERQKRLTDEIVDTETVTQEDGVKKTLALCGVVMEGV